MSDGRGGGDRPGVLLGPTDRARRPLFYGWLPGSEATGFFDWKFLQSRPNGQPAFVSLFRWVFGRDWDWSGFQVERDMATVDAALGPIVNDATRGSLRAFRDRGGKLIVYHGWADSLVPPDQTVAFYERLVRDAGGLCAYPAKAWWRGAGDPNDATNFVCSVSRPATP